jgi:hypothetical protein
MIAMAMMAAATQSVTNAERRPPPGVGHKLTWVLPEIFESVVDEADDD